MLKPEQICCRAYDRVFMVSPVPVASSTALVAPQLQDWDAKRQGRRITRESYIKKDRVRTKGSNNNRVVSSMLLALLR